MVSVNFVKFCSFVFCLMVVKIKDVILWFLNLGNVKIVLMLVDERFKNLVVIVSWLIGLLIIKNGLYVIVLGYFLGIWFGV